MPIIYSWFCALVPVLSVLGGLYIEQGIKLERELGLTTCKTRTLPTIPSLLALDFIFLQALSTSSILPLLIGPPGKTELARSHSRFLSNLNTLGVLRGQ